MPRHVWGGCRGRVADCQLLIVPVWQCPRRCAPRHAGSSPGQCPGNLTEHLASWPCFPGCSMPCLCPAPSCTGSHCLTSYMSTGVALASSLCRWAHMHRLTRFHADSSEDLSYLANLLTVGGIARFGKMRGGKFSTLLQAAWLQACVGSVHTGRVRSLCGLLLLDDLVQSKGISFSGLSSWAFLWLCLCLRSFWLLCPFSLEALLQ